MKWIGSQPAEAVKVQQALAAAHGASENAPPSKSLSNRFDRDYHARIVQWGGAARAFVVVDFPDGPKVVRNSRPIGATTP